MSEMLSQDSEKYDQIHKFASTMFSDVELCNQFAHDLYLKFGMFLTNHQYHNTITLHEKFKYLVESLIGPNHEYKRELKTLFFVSTILFYQDRYSSLKSQKLHKFETEFELLKEIGFGAFGKVYKARNKTDQRVYAVKKVWFQVNDKAEKTKKLQEVRVLSFLDEIEKSPFITDYKNAWIEKGILYEFIYIQMPLYDMTIDEFIWEVNHDYIALHSSHFIAQCCLVYLFRDVLSGINHLHQNGIIHCDSHKSK